MTHTTELYFECHITVEPVFGEYLDKLKLIATPHKFHVADLLMRKRLEDTPERSQFDTFLTGRGPDYEELESRMHCCINDVELEGYKVWRYKIENTLLDVRLPRETTTR